MLSDLNAEHLNIFLSDRFINLTLRQSTSVGGADTNLQRDRRSRQRCDCAHQAFLSAELSANLWKIHVIVVETLWRFMRKMELIRSDGLCLKLGQSILSSREMASTYFIATIRTRSSGFIRITVSILRKQSVN